MMKSEYKSALIIGIISIVTYISNYFLRNLLGVLTPQLLETGLYTVEFLALLSSTYMIFYAAGQLCNGFLGDIISPKIMVFAGLSLAGVGIGLFPFLSLDILRIACFAFLGFSLSMMRGPLMKIISENTQPNHARLICVFFSCASFIGPLIATFIAMIFAWKTGFIVSGIMAFVMALLSLVIFSGMEKKGIISYKSIKGQGFKAIFDVFKIEKFAFYMIIACLVEICAASLSFWIPTYLTNELMFEKEFSNMLYSGISIIRALMPFVSLAIFRASGEKDVGLMRIYFTIAAALFLSLVFIQNKWCSVGVLLLALMSMSCVSSLLWSIYIPGLGKTGRVSGVNGVLDCTGYIAAALANLVFAAVASNMGWSGVYVIWSLIGVTGLFSTFLVNKKK